MDRINRISQDIDICLADAEATDKTIGYAYAISQIQHLEEIL
jgi:hypothetical protein